MSKANQYDEWLQDAGPAALVIREYLAPVEGDGGVIFPSTFAAGDGFAGGYNIDTSPDGKNVCLIDSVGAQANRIEPIFERGEYAALVPQIVVKAGDKEINLLDAGHRAGDALVRCSALQDELRQAFLDVLKGDATALAKIAPTSLVFGVWDSRDTQAKLPRLVASTIRAFNVRRLTRSAQFNPATTYIDDGLLEDTDDKAQRGKYAERGFIHVPAAGSHGGVIADGGVRRDATLSLIGIRTLPVSQDPQRAQHLRRYILGLALTALTYPSAINLRQGCQLVLDPKQPQTFEEVHADGKRVPAKLTHDDALAYARAAAQEFGVGPSRVVDFDKDRAREDVSAEEPNGKKAKKISKKK